MPTRSRRWFLAGASTPLVLAIAGCSDAESEFLVTNTQIIHQTGDHRFSYPEDVLVRVTIENSHASRQQGQLELTLKYDGNGSDGHSPSWEKTDDIDLGQGTSTIEEYVFDDVFEGGNDIDDYRLLAELV